MDTAVFAAILNSQAEPVVFVDTNHIIRFVNKAASEKYRKHGFVDLVGKSIFEFHSEKSNQKIVDSLKALVDGENEAFLTFTKHYKVFMRAVKDSDGKVIGYFERFEKISA